MAHGPLVVYLLQCSLQWVTWLCVAMVFVVEMFYYMFLLVLHTATFRTKTRMMYLFPFVRKKDFCTAIDRNLFLYRMNIIRAFAIDCSNVEQCENFLF